MYNRNAIYIVVFSLEKYWFYIFSRSVRQGLLFALSMVYLAVPPSMLLNDLQQEVLESKSWLAGCIAVMSSSLKILHFFLFLVFKSKIYYIYLVLL